MGAHRGSVMQPILEPTPEQCNKHAQVWADENHIGRAIWYPQMGGYVGKAVAVVNKRWSEDDISSHLGGCVEVYVWHDGEFPFSGEDDPAVQPIHLHHCDPEQFIEFGKMLAKWNEREGCGGGSVAVVSVYELRPEAYEGCFTEGVIVTRCFRVRTTGPCDAWDVMAAEDLPQLDDKYSEEHPAWRCVTRICAPREATRGVWAVRCEYRNTKGLADETT